MDGAVVGMEVVLGGTGCFNWRSKSVSSAWKAHNEVKSRRTVNT